MYTVFYKKCPLLASYLMGEEVTFYKGQSTYVVVSGHLFFWSEITLVLLLLLTINSNVYIIVMLRSHCYKRTVQQTYENAWYSTILVFGKYETNFKLNDTACTFNQNLYFVIFIFISMWYEVSTVVLVKPFIISSNHLIIVNKCINHFASTDYKTYDMKLHE